MDCRRPKGDPRRDGEFVRCSRQAAWAPNERTGRLCRLRGGEHGEAFSRGLDQAYSAPQEELVELSDVCARAIRAPIESSPSWTAAVATLYRAVCETSWMPIARSGVEANELCGCLDKSARQAFPNPTQLWKFIRTKNRESLSASEKKAGRQMFDACARFIDPEK